MEERQMEKSTRAEFSYVIFFLAILCGYVFRLLPRNILLPGDVFMGLDVLRSAIYMELVLYWISSVKKGSCTVQFGNIC